MSSTSTTPSTTSSDQPFFTANPSTTAGSGGGGGGGNSSSLYLFTFLATLFLLLTVSCAIILRSFIVRRRFRRRIEEAILAGAILPSSPTGGPGSRRRDFGAKPRMWDTWVVPGASVDGGCDWTDIMPVSAVPTAYTPLSRTNAPPGPPCFAPADPPPRSSLRRMLHLPFPSRTRSPSPSRTPPVATAPVPADESEKARAEPRDMQVSVLIAMPDARHPHYGEMRGSAASVKGKERSLYSDTEDEELPEMVIGVAELPCRSEGAGGEKAS